MKAKQTHKNKEQLLADAKRQEELGRKRTMVKEVLYPFLLKTSTSIQDAKNMCEIVATGAQQAAYKKISDMKFSELGLLEQIADGEENQRYRDLMAIFKDETVASVISMIGDLPQAIDGFIKEETMSRPLDSLKVTLL